MFRRTLARCFFKSGQRVWLDVDHVRRRHERCYESLVKPVLPKYRIDALAIPSLVAHTLLISGQGAKLGCKIREVQCVMRCTRENGRQDPSSTKDTDRFRYCGIL